MKKSIMVEQMFKRLLSYYFVNVSKITNGICVNTISNTNLFNCTQRLEQCYQANTKIHKFPPANPFSSSKQGQFIHVHLGY